jgi:amicyanin
MFTRIILLVPALSLVFLVLPGCGTSESVSAPSLKAVQNAHVADSKSVISIDNFTFQPPTLTIAAGTKITWINHDDVPHTVRSTEQKFSSGALDTDDSYSFTFVEPGTYDYFCTVHSHMTGKVIVK